MGIFDREASRLLSYVLGTSDSSEIVINPLGGSHRYDIVVFHNYPDHGYELNLDFNTVDYDEPVSIPEMEPNNSIIEDQYLGTLSRGLSYEILGSGDTNDFYGFDIFGEYPLVIDLRMLSATNQAPLLSVWRRSDLKLIAQYQDSSSIQAYLELDAGEYLLNISAEYGINYRIQMGQGQPFLSPSKVISSATKPALPIRDIPMGIEYFAGLYRGAYSPVTPGKVVKINRPTSLNTGTRSLSLSRITNPLIQTISIPLESRISKSLNRISRAPSFQEKFADIFTTIKALEEYGLTYGQENIEASFTYYTSEITSNDPYYTQGNMWGIDAIHLPQAWETTKGSDEIIVAVIDTGIPYHVDLIANQADPSSKVMQGYDFIGMDDDPIVSSGNIHGGHVAGTIGAKTNNGEGVAGVNWNVKIMPLRVCATSSCDGQAIYNAILYAAGKPNSSGRLPSRPAHVINMSLGGPGQSSAYKAALEAALEAGVLPVCAAGNDNVNLNRTFYSPVGYDECLGVSAIDQNLNRAGFSKIGRAHV